MFNWKIFRLTLLILVFVELLSFSAFLLPTFNGVVWGVILFITLVLSMEKLEYGVFIIIAELIVGSFGYLFALPLGGVNISLRMGLFIVVFSVGLYTMLKEKKILFLSSKFFRYYIIFFLFLLLGIINGFWHNAGLSRIFFDVNGYVFFALLPVFYQAIKNKSQIKNLISVIVGALSASVIKLFVLLYFFSHQIWYFTPILYNWVRDTRIGEITRMGNGVYRIFFQSHIYIAISIFVGIVWLLFNSFLLPTKTNSIKDFFVRWPLILFLSSLLSVFIISMSRSLWVSTAFVFLFFLFFIIFYLKYFVEGGIKILFLGLCLSVVSFLLLFFIIKFPFPLHGRYDASFVSILSKRSLQVSGEEAVSSRWALLPKLIREIKKTPALGAGFGKTVTYNSSDPRVIAMSVGRTGKYSTTAFEWGYFEIWLKIGALGLIVYLALLFKILYFGLSAMSIKSFNRYRIDFLSDTNDILLFGLIGGLVILMVTHIFTPYLNHPLGIGYIMLVSVLTERLNT